MTSFMAEGIAGSLRAYCKDREDILLAFIFGSAVSGRLTKESDVDVAVLFRNKPDFSEVLRIRDGASEATGREIDLVLLNNASPVICMQVLRAGKLIKSEGASVYSNFVVKTVKEYADLKQIRKEAEAHILRGRIYA
ncbi:MAG: nucleotidyltransferase domain-containing protein [Nitrospirota bacterium]|nr:nucleotidyltransferase domain-containing protein [Nitrospirota bacterium]